MKQGRASHSGSSGQKVEPKSRAMNPGAVSEIGIHEVRTQPNPLHAGRGYKAPMAGSQIHRSGSQGKHK